METYYWWYAYGKFRPGANDLPHFGDVISHYLLLRGVTKEEFSLAYTCSKRFVDMLMSDANIDSPKSNSRRTFLSSLLKIPPALLGLPLLSSTNSGIITFIEAQHLMAYDDILSMSWSLYYGGNFQQATRNVQNWLFVLKNAVEGAKGVEKDQLAAIWCRFLHLSCYAARDRGNSNQALADGKMAVALAEELGNIELIASSHYHRARVYIQQERYKDALVDIEAALKYTDTVPEALKGNIYVGAGEIYTPLADDEATRTKALKFFDRASNIARKSELGGDSLIRFGLSKVYTERAYSLYQFGAAKGAQDALGVASKNLPADNIRWQKDFDLANAESCVQEGDIESAVQTIKHYLSLCQFTNSRSNHSWMKNLLLQCQQQEPDHSEVANLYQSLSSR